MKFFFKKIRIYLFILIYGSIKFNNSRLSKHKVKSIKITNKKYNIYELNNVRVYTDTNDIAYIDNDNKIIQGPSIQIRNSRYSNIRNNVSIKNGTPQILKKINTRTFSLLCGAHGNNNYFHWFFDVLPRIYIFKKVFKINSKDTFLVPSLEHEYQRESLKFLGIKNIVNAYKKNHLLCKKVIAVFFDAVNKKDDKIPRWATTYIAKSFTNKIKRNNKTKYSKIYIDRKDSNSNKIRKIINENDLKKYLKKENFTLISLSNLTFKKELSIFKNAKIVVGLYGAGLTNLIFMTSTKRVIELKHNKSGDLYKNIALAKNLKYSKVTCIKSNSNNKSERKFDGLIYCPINKLKKEIFFK